MSWARRRVRERLVVMHPAQRNWLPPLQTSHTSPRKVPRNGHRKTWMMSKEHEKVTLKYEIAWIWSRVHAWLAAMDPAQCNWLAQLHTSQAAPPTKSNNAHDTSPVTMVFEKHHLKARNHIMRSRVDAWLAATDPAQCNWLAQLQPSHTHRQ